jgi:orotate phosphoribosyltransferase
MTDYERLEQMLADKSVRRGEFILASGARSNIYIDARLTTMSPEGLELIGQLALNAIMTNGWNVQSVGGLTLGADPISYAISHASASTRRPIRAFTVRKHIKEHGTGKIIEGPFIAGDNVVVIEDVITTGTSAERAADAVAMNGGNVLGILAVVDREEGGKTYLERKLSLPVIALTTISRVLPLIKG